MTRCTAVSFSCRANMCFKSNGAHAIASYRVATVFATDRWTHRIHCANSRCLVLTCESISCPHVAFERRRRRAVYLGGGYLRSCLSHAASRALGVSLTALSWLLPTMSDGLLDRCPFCYVIVVWWLLPVLLPQCASADDRSIDRRRVASRRSRSRVVVVVVRRRVASRRARERRERRRTELLTCARA